MDTINSTQHTITTKEGTMATITRQYIIDRCVEQGVMDGLHHCCKTTVYALMLCTDGSMFAGTNMIQCHQDECPREVGELYEKCKTVCKQSWHGETSAIDNCLRLGGDPAGGKMYITGHTICCPGCQGSMKEVGMVYAASVDEDGKEYHF